MGHFLFLWSPDFWIGYSIIAACLAGPMSYFIGLHQWFKTYTKDSGDGDFPPFMLRGVCGLGMGAVFPLTILFYLSMGISLFIGCGSRKPLPLW